jgi:hypothetical protein
MFAVVPEPASGIAVAATTLAALALGKARRKKSELRKTQP